MAMTPAMPEAPATTAAPITRTVDITDAAVSPGQLVVAPGTRVEWANVGRNRHTSTADDGRWDSGALIPGDDFSISAPAEPGTYAYHCRFHSFIRGSLTVSLVALSAPAPVTVGGVARLSGTVPGASAGTPVSVERRLPGAWERVALATTAGDGSFSAVSPPLSARTAFRAVVGASLSPSVRAEVRPHLELMRHGSRLRVMIDPAGPARVTLSGLSLETYAWHRVARRALSGDGEATLPLARAGVYRVTVAAARGLSEATSAPIQFRPVRFHR